MVVHEGNPVVNYEMLVAEISMIQYSLKFEQLSARGLNVFELCLKVFIEFHELSDKMFVKRLFEPATSCTRDQDVTTESARHSSDRGSLN